MTLKMYVYDYGWAGASLYFSESKEKALKYFQDKNLPRYEEGMKNHDYEKSGPYNPWIEEVQTWSTDDFHEKIKEVELSEGLIFETEGE